MAHITAGLTLRLPTAAARHRRGVCREPPAARHGALLGRPLEFWQTLE
ncbi:MAG: hypothetical protein M3295_04985 [Chloroflexota bacterium]|nr:hypothetical protein [Chloroflexota bacterium]